MFFIFTIYHFFNFAIGLRWISVNTNDNLARSKIAYYISNSIVESRDLPVRTFIF